MGDGPEEVAGQQAASSGQGTHCIVCQLCCAGDGHVDGLRVAGWLANKLLTEVRVPHMSDHTCMCVRAGGWGLVGVRAGGWCRHVRVGMCVHAPVR